MADRYDPSENEDAPRGTSGKDAEAFRQIHREHEKRVFAFALRLLGGRDYDAASDITMETFVRLWSRWGAYRERGEVNAYLLRIAYNLCQDARRSKRSLVSLDGCAEIAATSADVGEAVAASSLEDAVRKAVARLPEAQRVVFVLSHYEQMTYREIAEALGCPIGTVASRKFLAVEALRKSLRHWLPGKE